jgi:hypothetical protein
MATGTVSLWTDISALNHHLKRRKLRVSAGKRERKDGRHTNFRDDTMELAALVTEPGPSSRELAEVTGGFGAFFIVELEDDSTGGLGVDGDVKLQARQRQLGKTKWMWGGDARKRY